MNNPILEKIKKLLRMKNGGTAGEIENALALAQKLASKHGIDINTVDENEPDKEPITHGSGASLKRIPIEYKYAAIIIIEFFNVNAIINRWGITFIGTTSDIEIAKYILNFLVKHARREWNIKRGRLRNRKSFILGIFMGIRDKLISEKPVFEQKEGLVLANKIKLRKEYISKVFGQMNPAKIKTDATASAALNKGYKLGRETNIRKGVESNQVGRKLLNEKV